MLAASLAPILKICCSFCFNIAFYLRNYCTFARNARILANTALAIASCALSALLVSSSYFLSFSISLLMREKLGISMSISAHNAVPTFL
jgi:hypothetical protein